MCPSFIDRIEQAFAGDTKTEAILVLPVRTSTKYASIYEGLHNHLNWRCISVLIPQIHLFTNNADKLLELKDLIAVYSLKQCQDGIPNRSLSDIWKEKFDLIH